MTTYNQISVGLKAVSPILASIPGDVKVYLAWNPQLNTDAGWLVLLYKAANVGPTTIAATGLAFRDFNIQSGINGDEGPLSPLLNIFLDVLPNRSSWRIQLAWDSSCNRDVGWLCFIPSSPSYSVLSSLQLRRWNLGSSVPENSVVSHSTKTTVPYEDGSSFLNPSSVSFDPSPSLPKAPKSVSPNTDLNVTINTDKAECSICHKLIARIGLNTHMKRLHSETIDQEQRVQTTAPSPRSSPSSQSLPSSSSSPSSTENNTGNEADDSSDLLILTEMPASGTDLPPSAFFQVKEEPQDPPPSPLPQNEEDFCLDQSKTKDKTRATVSVESQKCSIVFQLEGRKLKLTTLVKKQMSKAMAEFAKHRKLKSSSLQFRVKQTGEEVDGMKLSGEYAGRLVIVKQI